MFIRLTQGSQLTHDQSHQNKGMMFWDGKNIRVWTGGTKWAVVTLSGDTRG